MMPAAMVVMPVSAAAVPPTRNNARTTAKGPFPPVFRRSTRRGVFVIELAAQTDPRPTMTTPASPSFKIIGGDGREYGPIDLATLQQWTREGRLRADTRVWDSRNGAWQTAAQVAELATVLGVSAPPPLPPATPAMAPAAPPSIGDYSIAIGDWFNAGWEFFKRDLGFTLGAFWVAILVSMVASFIPCVGGVVSLFVQPPLLAGMWMVLIARYRGQPARIGDIFDGFKLFFINSVVANLLIALFVVLACIPGAIGLVLGIGAAVTGAQGQGLSHLTAAGVLTIAVAVVVMIVPVLYLTVSYLFALPLVAERRLGFWEAMETSRKVVGKHWWGWLGFVILVWLLGALLGALACGVGLIFTLPLASAVFVAAYDDVFGARRGPGASATP